MDLLTTALGCVLLIFIVYSLITSGDLQEFLRKNSNLIEAVRQRDKVIAIKEQEAQVLQGLVEKLKSTLSEKEREALAQLARHQKIMSQMKNNHATSLEQLIRDLELLRNALDPETARPVDVMLVIDGTNSMAPSLQAVRQNLRAII